MKKTKKLLFFILIIATFFGSLFLGFKYNQDKIEKERKETVQRNKDIKAEKEMNNINTKMPTYDIVDGITNILLVGADFREGETQARSDTMIILTMDTVNDKIKLTSLLRDTLVYIPGHGKSKLNHSFAYGGIDLLKDTIYANFGLRIDDYSIIDFNTFKDTVDVLGGVELDIQEDELEELNKYIFDVPNVQSKKIEHAGKQVLDGAQALSYVRIRYNCGGEERRTERQRALLTSLYNKFKDTQLSKYPSLLKSVINNVDTNLGFTEMTNLAYTAFKLDIKDIETLRLPIEELSIGGIYQEYGWVFRTDLEKTGQVLVDYIYKDKAVDASEFDGVKINYMK